MRLFFLMAVMMLGVVAIGCEDMAGTEDLRGVQRAATSRPPATPESPRAPLRMDGTIPTTPRPADTALPANTPLSVMTPLAVLPSYTPEPTATVAPRATAVPVDNPSAKEKREEYIARCKHWALRSMKPIEYSRFEQLDPYNMTDLERILWGSVIVESENVTDIRQYYYQFGRGDGMVRFEDEHVEWCHDYWSEPLSEENAHKRNHEAYRIECLLGLASNGAEYERSAEEAYERPEYHEDMSPVLVNQWIRLLNWLDIDGDTLLALDEKPFDLIGKTATAGNYLYEYPTRSVSTEDVEWWGIARVWYDVSRVRGDYELAACRSYYPQLFIERWVPLDSFYAERWLLEKAQSALDREREEDWWPDWGEEKGRDILIRLE